MIYSVTVINYKGESLKMELARPERCGIIVEKIDGIGPTDVDINSCNQASIDGAIFNSSRIGTRTITLTLRMMFDPIIEDSRHKVYRYFPIKKRVTLIFETDYRTLQCSGYVKSNDPDIFSDEEKCTVDVFCTDPFFYALGDSEMSFSGVRPNFEFRWENDEEYWNIDTWHDIPEQNEKEVS